MNNKKILFCSVIAIAISFTVYKIKFSNNLNLVKNEAHRQISNAHQNSINYCMAIRGNGDYQPAHWGAMATTIEKLGLPQAMSGGSSATVSMFILESIAKNPFVDKANESGRKEMASFLLKSLLGFTEATKNSVLVKSAFSVYENYKYIETKQFTQKIRKLLMSQNWIDLKKHLLDSQIEIPVNDQVLKLIFDAVQKKDKAQVRFYLNEIENSAKVFGNFDAKNDDNLFFRFGLVSFEKMAGYFGKVAGFYSTEGDSAQTLSAWKDLINQCSINSIGKTWPEIVQQNPVCQNLFSKVFNSHFNDIHNKAKPELNQAGLKIPMYASTAVIIGTEATRYNKAFTEYIKTRDVHYGLKYKIKNPDQVVFGYWGDPKKLTQIKNNLDMSIEKNKKFYSLGDATWLEILSLSPAEPGLSNLKPFTKDNINYVSAGGWSDLAPTLVLKASGCENIVYLTRQGGDSLFAQGVAKRLLNLDISWDKLETSNDIISKRNILENDLGQKNDLNSNWSMLYNIANPQSSLRISLSVADAILCTDWNNYDPKSNLIKAVDSSYKALFAINDQATFELRNKLSPELRTTTSGCKY